MATMGFHYTKITADKTGNTSPNIKVNNKILLLDVKEAKLNVGNEKQKAIEFSFDYKATYEPEIGSIQLLGKVLFVDSEEKVKIALDKWKKDKILPPEVLQEVYNPILERCSIEALFLSRDMQLPPHIPLPKMNAEVKPAAEIKEKEVKETKKKK